ncbi:ABC transporter ATP-binding protein [Bacillus marasmi]|uniref:ABC transporter ATP-binding protein n=1 Tax=Bacillus marasmi TaxID=1926279 RepID=UPI001C9C9D54|nr:ABC transporter ATP-binding protein [Bacillus marasmi]
MLEISNLSKHYNQFSLQDVSFSLKPGYIMGFIGPNGAGKSTTIKIIMNLIKKSSGDIKVFGLDHLQHEKEIKSRIGFVYDENHYYENLTIPQIEKIIAPFYKKWDHGLFNKLIQDFQLPHKKKLKDFSKGMKMKFSLAIALSHKAELIIMDEPTAGLDPVFRSELLTLLSDIIQDENVSVFFSTHITTDLEKIADYITFINDGKIVFSETKDTVIETYAIVKGNKELLDDETRKLFISIRESSFGFEGLTNNLGQFSASFKQNAIIEKASLEDIMVYTVRRREHV